MSNPEYTLQNHVNVVCDFLEVTPTVVSKDDTIDSVTNKIKCACSTSKFANKMLELSDTYDPLKVETLIDAVQNVPSSDSALRSVYHINVKKLDDILGMLTKDYCADACNSKPFRCCGEPHTYNFNVKDDQLLKLQETESGIYEEYSDLWPIPGCKYLSEVSGCMLKVSKTPLCLGFMCDPLKGYLKVIAPSASEEFIYEMREVQNTPTITPEAVNVLNRAIVAGEKVLIERDSKI